MGAYGETSPLTTLCAGRLVSTDTSSCLQRARVTRTDAWARGLWKVAINGGNRAAVRLDAIQPSGFLRSVANRLGAAVGRASGTFWTIPYKACSRREARSRSRRMGRGLNPVWAPDGVPLLHPPTRDGAMNSGVRSRGLRQDTLGPADRAPHRPRSRGNPLSKDDARRLRAATPMRSPPAVRRAAVVGGPRDLPARKEMSDFDVSPERAVRLDCGRRHDIHLGPMEGAPPAHDESKRRAPRVLGRPPARVPSDRSWQ